MKPVLKFVLAMLLATAFSAAVFAQRNDSENPRKLGEQWIKAENYTLYASSSGRNQCTDFIPEFVLVYDVPANYVFESEGFIKLALDTFETKCSGSNLKQEQIIKLNIYFKDKQIGKNKDDGYYSIGLTSESYEIPFLILLISRNQYTKYEWRVTPNVYSTLNEYQKPWSLETLEKNIAKRKQDAEKAKIEMEKYYAEQEKFKAEAPQREAAAAKQRIIDERNLSVPVLRLIKPNAPETYNFTGYSNQKVFEAIYKGEFSGFVSRKELDNAVFEAEEARNNADPRLALEMLANMIQSGAKLSAVIDRYKELASYYFAYHNTYFELCGKNKEVPWVTGEVYKFWLTRDGRFVEGSEKYGYSGSIRAPYKETHVKTYELLAKRLQAKPQISEETLGDFKKFLQTEGCSSPTVRNFEANLYLATNLRLPLQVLYDRALIEPVTKQNTENQSPKVSNKSDPKTAPKKKIRRKN
ncbi:MAG TPA: hypothetical protein PKY59_22825 [Pyrinomonadaceae bacterium]|nr:hypothetical protein [Pyrinomonadaceae bacterium]